MPGIRDFRDKVVVVTGAGSGIGRAAAKAFAREGADVVVADIRADRVAETVKEIESAGGKAIGKELDVSDRSQIEELAKFVISKKGRVDVLYNNAGVAVGGPVEDSKLEDWEWIFKINLWGVIHGVHYFLPYMIERKYGHIVNTASGAGLIGLPGHISYVTTKFAVVGFSEALRAELRRHNIGVTVICPGAINTNIVTDARIYMREGAKAQRENIGDLFRKYGWPPERVANAVLRGVRKNIGVVPVGPEMWLGWYLKRISYKLSDVLLAFSAKKSL